MLAILQVTPRNGTLSVVLTAPSGFVLRYEVTGDAEVVKNDDDAVMSVNLNVLSTSTTPLSGPVSRMFADGAAVTVKLGANAQLPCKDGYNRTAPGGSCATEPVCALDQTINATTHDCAPVAIACPPDTTNQANKRCFHVIHGNYTCPSPLFLKNDDCFAAPSCSDALDTVTESGDKWLCNSPEVCQAYYKEKEGGGCVMLVPLEPLPALAITIDTATSNPETGATSVAGTITWTRPADLTDIEGFRLYHAGDDKAPLSGGLIRTFPVANTSWTFTDLELHPAVVFIIGVPYNTAGELLSSPAAVNVSAALPATDGETSGSGSPIPGVSPEVFWACAGAGGVVIIILIVICVVKCCRTKHVDEEGRPRKANQERPSLSSQRLLHLLSMAQKGSRKSNANGKEYSETDANPRGSFRDRAHVSWHLRACGAFKLPRPPFSATDR